LQRFNGVIGDGRVRASNRPISIGAVAAVRVLCRATDVERNGSIGAIAPGQSHGGAHRVPFEHTSIRERVLVVPVVIPSDTLRVRGFPIAAGDLFGKDSDALA